MTVTVDASVSVDHLVVAALDPKRAKWARERLLDVAQRHADPEYRSRARDVLRQRFIALAPVQD